MSNINNINKSDVDNKCDYYLTKKEIESIARDRKSYKTRDALQALVSKPWMSLYSVIDNIYQDSSSQYLRIAKSLPLPRKYLAPFIKYHIREKAKTKYIKIKYAEYNLYYQSISMEGYRGIARVSRALFDVLIRDIDEVDISNAIVTGRHSAKMNVKELFFFPTVHWCPERLPQNSIVFVHDVTPLLFPSSFKEAARSVWLSRHFDAVQQASKVITGSKASANLICECLSINANKISVIPHGVSLEHGNDCVVDNFKPPYEKYVVFVGTLDPHKNIQVIFDALHDDRINQVNLVLIGDCEKAKSIVEKYGIASRVYFAGEVDDETLFCYLRSALALVFPTLYEGFGLPPFEAAQFGTPSICSNRPAMNEYLFESCLLVDPEKPSEWVDAILRLNSDDGLKNQLIDNCNNLVRDSLSWEDIVPRYKRIFDDFINT